MKRPFGIIHRCIVALTLGAISCIAIVLAEQPTLPRVGVISIPPNEELVRSAFRERGYVEGKTISIDWRSRYTSDDELKSVATELVHLGVDVIVTFGTPAALAALSATSTIPVIFSAGDPVATGLAESLVKPGRNGRELDKTLRALHHQSADAVLVTADLLFQLNKAAIARAVRRAKLPAVVPYKAYLDDGTLSSYGPNLNELSSKIPTYVDRILKGAKPSDLPIEQVSTYELVIDLRAARMLGMKVPSDLLYRADEVIR